jgi:hypothetical protein
MFSKKIPTKVHELLGRKDEKKEIKKRLEFFGTAQGIFVFGDTTATCANIFRVLHNRFAFFC